MAPIKKPSTAQIALTTILPLILVVGSTTLTMLFIERYKIENAPVILVGWCLVLMATAFLLNRSVFESPKTFLPFLAAVLVILGIWLWQKIAFLRFVPTSGLSYGFFHRPDGTRAHFWVLACPFWVGVTCLSLLFLFAMILWWRSGARVILLSMIPWWLAAPVVFALPSMYLDGQGNASIVI